VSLRAEIRDFVESELVPHADRWEDARWMPDETFKRMGDAGLLGLKYETEYGGRGLGYLEEAILATELARCGSGGVGASLGGHINIATPPVWKFGTEEQKQRWLVPGIRGELIGALAITEPHAGSDVASARTRAEEVEGGWVVNGSKTYITNGVRAGFYVTALKTTPEGGHHGMSFLVIERGEGVTTSKLEKLGWHASDTAEVFFEDVFVPAEHLLGELNRGFHLIMANFQWERLGMALGAIGKMRHSFEKTLEHVGESGQASRHAFAEMATSLAACEALTYHALRLFAHGEDALKEVTMAKLLTQRAAVDLHETCLRLLGHEGYSGALGIERALRDARLGPIGGGSDEIMKEILARLL
jgi:acyl-CoA dehydrogenase